jgi:signal transduction histidine kinase
MQETTLNVKGKILIVEDEALVAQHIEEQLEDFGYEVLSSVSYGELASEEVKLHQPDLVLMDIMLKGEMNGIEAARQIKTISSVPVVFLTAYGDMGMFEKAKSTKPYGFLTKPFRPQELHAAIELGIAKHKEDAENQKENKVSTGNQEKNIEAIEKAWESKRELFLRMNHELRTPLNAVLGFGKILEAELEGHLTTEQKMNLEQITKSSDELWNVLKSIIDLSTIENKKFHVSLEKIDVAPLIKNLVKIMQPLANKTGVTLFNHLDIHKKIWVLADSKLLSQALMNIITNAIQYNKKDGSVLIEVKFAKNNKIQICVSDTGPGISNEILSTIFDPFNRAGREYSDIQGPGLGLSVAKGLMELMNGSISVESEVEIGTCFTLELPMPTRAEDQPGLAQISLTGNNKKKILYVEDHPENVELVEQILKHSPHIELISASNALDGIKMAVTQIPDLILMDIQLPEMDGITAFKRLQIINETKNIPVIALTADAMDDDIKKALGMGFKNYITKPINMPKFLNIIDEVLT